VAIPNAIAATGQAIVALIAGAMPHEELAATQFELYQAMDFSGPYVAHSEDVPGGRVRKPPLTSLASFPRRPDASRRIRQ
jgi:hypothetical protein